MRLLSCCCPADDQKITAQDIIIFVIGPSGVGKSTFINAATKGQTHALRVGHGLEACTNAIESVRCFLPGDEQQRHIVFVDTPALDGDIGLSSNIEKKLKKWMKNNHVKEGGVSRILYMRNIDGNRMANISTLDLIMFTATFCGRDAPGEKILLATTMWGEINPNKEQHEREFRTDKRYWGGMIEKGSDMARFNNTTESAWDVVNFLLRDL